jgi:hypothetical protein
LYCASIDQKRWNSVRRCDATEANLALADMSEPQRRELPAHQLSAANSYTRHQHSADVAELPAISSSLRSQCRQSAFARCRDCGNVSCDSIEIERAVCRRQLEQEPRCA